ncbi:MAG TPA: hypothetical protein VKG02_08750 [Blastocatellia bacterium]|nr:hypothetical protein [Blastocatellia bacterium]
MRTSIPTQAGRALPNNLLRAKFPGYGDINQEQFGGHTTYHGLQVSAQRRFSRGLQFGLAYTWSKSLGTTTFDPMAPDNERRNYGPTAADRRHNLSVNYVYDLPKLGKRLNNKVVGAVTDDWTLSGITSAVSGAPFTPTFTTSPSIDITGSANSTARVNVIGDAQKPTTPGTYFNTAAFAAPAVGTLGSAGVNMVTGPGYLNWDVTLTKNIRLDEKHVLKFRTEAYNIFNHTQFSALNTDAQFNASGAQINNDFGRPTATRSPRVISFALRFEF